MFQYRLIPYTLQFAFPAGTSRGVLTTKQTWFLALWHSDFPGRTGWGEAGLLPGLSPENPASFQVDFQKFTEQILPLLETQPRMWENLSRNWMETFSSPWLPSALFALETAWLDWVNGGTRLICDSRFHLGQWSLPINGLVWMNPRKTMEEQAAEKWKEGFDTLKFKVGALDWDQELEMLRQIRSRMPESLQIRLDANGAWKEEEALRKLDQLAPLQIESIEQPIAAGQSKAMARICQKSPIPVALDEELISKPWDQDKFSLLEEIQPPYVVLKPSLLGGLGQTNQWIRMAEDLGIGWWITSMLESHVGLNSIAQLAAQYHPSLPQGLGTGKIYTNGPLSPLTVENGQLTYKPGKTWNLEDLEALLA